MVLCSAGEGEGSGFDDKSVTSCQQTFWKLIVKPFLSTGLLQVVSTSCNKSANDKLQQA